MNKKVDFDFGFEKVKIKIYTPKANNQYRDGTDQKFVIASFTSKSHLKPTIHRCFQDEPLQDIENDFNSIKKGDICNTRFYKHWMVLFFSKDKEYDLVVSDRLKKKNIKGVFKGLQNIHKPTSFYFYIDDKEVPAKELHFVHEEYRYKL